MTQTILIVLCLLVIFSYLFDLFAKQTKVPSVLLLLLTGIGLRYLSDYLNVGSIDFMQILPTIGTIGLVLIVFEGALELRYDKSKNVIIRKSFISALVILLITVFGIAYIIQVLTDAPLYACFINAIPLGIISSAVAIPSSANIEQQKKEFIVYESSFSDILGIILFNFALINSELTPAAFGKLGIETISILLISAIFCLFLIYIMGKIKHHVKFFLIISILVLVYAIGKEFHLSSLIIVLAFGLFLSNAGQIILPLFRKNFLYPNFNTDLQLLFQLSAESAFLVRTFFFIIFGFVMDMQALEDYRVYEFGLPILLAIYLVRLVALKFLVRTDLLPEVFITPRGLISILLFFSLPEHLKIEGINNGVLFVVILGTGIIMTLGLLGAKKQLTYKDEATG